MGYKVWGTVDQINSEEYLYHYTTIEKAYKILYYDTLRFSNICSTNDIFEQKPKILFESLDVENIKKASKVSDYLSKEREKLKILCFSKDLELDSDLYKKMCNNLTKDQIRANVIGRGFALPRMWAQYAANNEGTCLIINKKKLINLMNVQSIIYTSLSVEYTDSYSPYPISNESLNKTYNFILEGRGNDIISKNHDYVKQNFFSKLSDWESENEFRIITIADKKDQIIQIKRITSAIDGVVIGHNVDDLHTKLIKSLSNEKCDIRRILFGDTITSIIKIY